MDTFQNPKTATGSDAIAIDDPSISLLDDLTAQAAARYAIKDYISAAELYSRATELQAEINGEMSPENADLLYAYGRCLYHVAVRSSDVLGSKVAGEKQDEGEKKGKRRKVEDASATNGFDHGEQRTAEEVITEVVMEKDATTSAREEKASDGKPFFQFTGDENYDDSEEEDEAEDGEAAAEENAEEDDFSNAYEVLDLARILLQRRFEELQGSEKRGKAHGDSETVKHLRERLADTHDLQAEISLEGERFPNAVVDLKAALDLKKELFPGYSSILAEAHFKLSLALEFSSVTQQNDENGVAEAGKQAHVDEAMREEAAVEMEAAISSCKLRIKREEEALTSGSTTNSGLMKSKLTKESIDDVKEMVKDMEQRLVELRQPPVSINDPTGTGTIDGANPLSGILGSILGESPEVQKARLEEASKGANDLTQLVKRKKPAQDEAPTASREAPVKGDGKRKANFGEKMPGSADAKKAKMNDEHAK